MAKHAQIPIGLLRLDTKNPRLWSGVHGEHVFSSLLENQVLRGHIYKLALHIAKHQLALFDLPIVVQGDDTTYTVLEGNRRLCAMMLLLNPERGAPFFRSGRLQRLQKAADQWSAPDTILCVLAASRSEAAPWIKLKHGGALQGVGTVPWDPREKAQFFTDNDDPDPTLEVVHLVESVATRGLLERIRGLGGHRKLRFTNLERFIEDEKCRALLGIDVRGDRVWTNVGRCEATKRLTALMEFALHPDVDVTWIEDSRQRVELLESGHFAFDRDLQGDWCLLSDAPEQVARKATEDQLDLGSAVSNAGGGGQEGLATTSEESARDAELQGSESSEAADAVRAQQSDKAQAKHGESEVPRARGAEVGTGEQTAQDSKGEEGADSAGTTRGDEGGSASERNDDPDLAPTADGDQAGTLPPKPKRRRRPRQRRRSIDRKYLIPKSVKLDIDAPRINDIFRELKGLKVEGFPNALAVLFRVFLELSLDSYLKRWGLRRRGGLPDKGKRVCKHLQDHDVFTEREVIVPMAFINSSGPTSANSVDYLHQYVHNPDHSPQEAELKTHWDNLKPLFEAMWSHQPKVP